MSFSEPHQYRPFVSTDSPLCAQPSRKDTPLSSAEQSHKIVRNLWSAGYYFGWSGLPAGTVASPGCPSHLAASAAAVPRPNSRSKSLHDVVPNDDIVLGNRFS